MAHWSLPSPARPASQFKSFFTQSPLSGPVAQLVRAALGKSRKQLLRRTSYMTRSRKNVMPRAWQFASSSGTDDCVLESCRSRVRMTAQGGSAPLVRHRPNPRGLRRLENLVGPTFSLKCALRFALLRRAKSRQPRWRFRRAHFALAQCARRFEPSAQNQSQPRTAPSRRAHFALAQCARLAKTS